MDISRDRLRRDPSRGIRFRHEPRETPVAQRADESAEDEHDSPVQRSCHGDYQPLLRSEALAEQAFMRALGPALRCGFPDSD